MSDPQLSLILADLAAGRIDAAEAARRIDALKQVGRVSTPCDSASETSRECEPPCADEPSNQELRDREGWQTGRPQTPGVARESFFSADEPADEVPPSNRRRPHSSKGVDRICVRAVGRRVRIVGDYSVTTVAAEGPHILRRNGSVLEITSDGEVGPSLEGFSMLRPPRSLDDLRALSLGKELYLRVNPGIIVDAEVIAGSLTTQKLPYLGKLRITAGGATLCDVAEANDLLVQAGQATLKGSIRTGRSRVRCESGSLIIQLEDDSNVTVKGESNLGRIHWAGPAAGSGNLDEVVMGNGSARLDIGVVMGHASVRCGAEER